MTARYGKTGLSRPAVVVGALLIAGCATLGIGGGVNLGGSQEVPPVNTQASGSGKIQVAKNKTVKGSVTTSGVDATAAHIHMGAAGQNGPVIITLVKTGPNTWSVPNNAKLTDAQYEAYKKGNLYVNVHSAAHPGGEIRAQIKGG
jgi:hypothetical protein